MTSPFIYYLKCLILTLNFDLHLYKTLTLAITFEWWDRHFIFRDMHNPIMTNPFHWHSGIQIWWREYILFLVLWTLCPSLNRLSAHTPLKLLIRFWQNFTCSKDIICSCAYYQGHFDPLIFMWSYAPSNLDNLPEILINIPCQHNSSWNYWSDSL